MIDVQKVHSSWSPRLLSILRIVVSLLFMQHGGQKLFGVPSNQPFHSFAPFSLMWIAGVLEFFGGAFLFLGLFTRPVAFILAGEMVVAYFMAHAPYGLWPLLNHGELAVLYCFVFLYLIIAGGGVWSLDAFRSRLAARTDGQKV
jgi:putative oxidoreductase